MKLFCMLVVGLSAMVGGCSSPPLLPKYRLPASTKDKAILVISDKADHKTSRLLIFASTRDMCGSAEAPEIMTLYDSAEERPEDIVELPVNQPIRLTFKRSVLNQSCRVVADTVLPRAEKYKLDASIVTKAVGGFIFPVTQYPSGCSFGLESDLGVSIPLIQTTRRDTGASVCKGSGR